MPDDGDHRLLQRIVDLISPVPGVHAIVLGGSRARGIALEDSDYDIGLYYDSQHPFDRDALQRAVSKLDRSGAQLTPIGGWGPWIDGGGWLTVEGRRVDLLYRDLHKVRHIIDDCCMGHATPHYQPGHPHAFVSATYLGEVACGRALHDPSHAFAALQRLTTPYPAALREKLSQGFLWEAEFALQNAEKGVSRSDRHYLAGCAFRCIACLCQVLFALNGEYLLNEKNAVAQADGFKVSPPHFRDCVETIYRDIGSGALQDGLERLHQVVRETASLVRDGED